MELLTAKQSNAKVSVGCEAPSNIYTKGALKLAGSETGSSE